MDPSREEVRAARACAAVESWKRGQQLTEELLQLGRRVPVMLRVNGLLATWAFLLAKGKEVEDKPHHRMLRTLHEHAAGVFPDALSEEGSADQFRRWVGDGRDGALSGTRLRQLTDELVLYAGWLKRAVEMAAGDR